jgi:hypothetical protein
MSSSGLVVSEHQSYLFSNLFPHSITMGFSGRHDGNMSFSHGDCRDSRINRQRFLQGLDIEASRLVCVKQVHGDSIACVTGSDAGRGWDDPGRSIPDTDALITGQRRVALSIMTADCLSVFLYDAQNGVIGLVHAGWRGTFGNITGKTVQAMMKTFDCRPENIYAGFGPSMRGCCYEVGEEFAERFTYGLISKDGRFYLDLAAVNTRQLLSREIKRENIFDSGVCTSCNGGDCFSYRREKDSAGRSMSVIMMR